MTMKQGVYICAVGFIIHIRSAATTLETVWLKDATAKFLTEKRTLSNIDFPNELAFHLTRRSETLTLKLRRNHDINPNPDFYFARNLHNGQLILVKSRNTEKEDVAYYQDVKNGAFITVRCVKKSNEQCHRIISGNVRIRDRDYELQPAEVDVVSRNVLEDSGHLSRQYILEDQTHTQREYSVKKEDAADENEKNIGQKGMSLRRRFQEQHKQKYLSASVATLTSRNISTVHNRGRTDISRELPKIYHVKMAVLIDYGLWDLFLSTVHSTNNVERRQYAQQKIQTFYSHIMNGVNMLYKGIEDPSIRINVILSEFIIFENKDDFPHNLSGPVAVNGIDHIDDSHYLDDLEEWDKKTDMKRNKTFSHGMLFTRYELYDKFPNDTDTDGLTFFGEVCIVGGRMSVIQTGGYVRMVTTATHELGHSLGAHHDGEGEAIACKAEDRYIMTGKDEEDYPGKPYSKNRWLFSNCSVNSFKVTLKDKTCVRDIGRYYNNEEYHKHVRKQPGEVFTVQEQCKLISGLGSVLCETALKDVCLLMRCRDPKTGICSKKYHGAARGTECGRNKWCIHGLCVPKR